MRILLSLCCIWSYGYPDEPCWSLLWCLEAGTLSLFRSHISPVSLNSMLPPWPITISTMYSGRSVCSFGVAFSWMRWSLTRITFIVCSRNTQYIVRLSYPTNIPFYPRWSNSLDFTHSSSWTSTYKVEPNVRKWLISGLWLVFFFSGDEPSRALLERRFFIWAATSTTSGQRLSECEIGILRCCGRVGLPRSSRRPRASDPINNVKYWRAWRAAYTKWSYL